MAKTFGEVSTRCCLSVVAESAFCLQSPVFMNAPVSVVIPCFRCSATIDRAVESVFHQTLRPYEVILVDDCSGDQTVEKLNEVKVRYPSGWVQVVTLEINAGPGTARNKGWDVSDQEYIAFLDSDDSWHPRKIELQYSWMKAHPAVMLTGHKCLVVSENEKIDLIRKDPPFNEPKEINLRKLLLSNYFKTPSVILKRNINFRMIEGKRYSEDYHAWLNIVSSGGAAYFFDSPLAFLYKSEYGDGGLSGNLWRLERGELDTYWRIYKDKRIKALTFFFASSLSLAKYVRRAIFVFFRKHRDALS